MPIRIPTLWRFILPLLVILALAPYLLGRHQEAQQLETIEVEAHDQAHGLVRLLNITDQLVSERVESSLRLLKQQSLALGPPAINGALQQRGREIPDLTFGHASAQQRNQVVDSVSSLLGATATVFARVDDQFVRIATSLQFPPGNRATGSMLNPRGKARAKLLAGEPFHGIADILGIPFITRYEPLLDANGTMIGAWSTAYPLDVQPLREAVENMRYLRSGFAAVLDDQGALRFHSAHVPPATVLQHLQHPASDWVIAWETVPQWGYRVAVCYPLKEARAASLHGARTLYGIASALSLALLMLLLWQLRRLVLNPQGADPAAVIDVMQRIAAGDLAHDGQQAKPGTLMANVLDMRRKLRDALATLQQHAERMRLSASVFEHGHDGILVTDADGRIIEVNPAFSRITGYPRDAALGKSPADVGFVAHDPDFFTRLWQTPAGTGEWRGETWNRRRNGELYAACLDLFVVRAEGEEVGNFVGVFSDITLVKEHQQHLEQMAYHDPLTQLPNRALLVDRMQQAIARAHRSGELLAVCYFDLDGFKPVNDHFGHEAGDQLLIKLARRVRDCLRESDTIARLGGDEFVVLLCGLQIEGEVQQTLERLLAAINVPFVLADGPVRLSASLGYTIYPQDNSEADLLLRHADHAMYQAKVNGGGRYHLFDAEHDRQTRGKRLERQRIEAALPGHEFCLYYQPLVDMRQGVVVGLEALIRWQHPQMGLRAPSEFLPLIEDSLFAVTLGEWVIEEALRQLKAWMATGLQPKVSINISARHMMQADFAARLAAMLKQYPEVPPRLLELEITETAAIEDVAGVALVINSCKLLGVGFALDDFGVGYSSLTYLRRLPVEVVKIDQSFVRDMLHDSDDLAVVSGVISLSRDFQRQVVAEGVETAEHGLRLLQLGCDLAQGYGIARPMPAAAIPGWLAAYQPDPRWITT